MNNTYNDEAEKAVIGTILQYPEKIIDVDLIEDDFGTQNHRMIYSAICAVDSSEVPVDIITISDYLDKQTGKNWLPIVGQLGVYGEIKSKSIKAYAGMVREASLARRSAVIAHELIDRVGVSGQNAVDDAIRALMELSSTKQTNDCSLHEALKEAVEKIDEVFHHPGTIPGLHTGLIDVDERLGGLHNSDLIVIGARPAMGKTSALLQWAINAGVPAGIISAEMSRCQLALRMISMEGKVNSSKLRNGNIEDNDWLKITSSAGKLNQLNIWINDTGNPHIDNVIRQARIWKHNHNIGILLVDYIQEMKGMGSTLREQIISIVTGLKALAKELDIPVVALAQVNRAVEDRGDKRPMVADLQESGKIEQAADQIIMLYRDEVYNAETISKGIAEFIVRKNRHGPIGTIKTVWLGEYMRFENEQKTYYP